MPTLDQLISSGEGTISEIEDAIIAATKKSEADILTEVQKILKAVDIAGGKLKTTKKATQFLMTLEDRVREAMKGSGYNNAVLDFVRSFDKVKQNSIAVSEKANGLIIKESALTEITQLEVSNAVDRLLGSGVAKDFVQPIRESLYRSIALGSDVASAEKTMSEFIKTTPTSDSRLLRYVKQVSQDTLSQYDGSIQAKISQELNLDAVMYVGSIIRDSRAQCRKWVAMRKIAYEELQEQIDWALKGGSYKGKQCTGMNPATTVDTFLIYRGGFKCRHRGIAVKI